MLSYFLEGPNGILPTGFIDNALSMVQELSAIVEGDVDFDNLDELSEQIKKFEEGIIESMDEMGLNLSSLGNENMNLSIVPWVESSDSFLESLAAPLLTMIGLEELSLLL